MRIEPLLERETNTINERQDLASIPHQVQLVSTANPDYISFGGYCQGGLFLRTESKTKVKSILSLLPANIFDTPFI